MESRSFWLDTIPLSKDKAARRATAAQFPRNFRATSGVASGATSAQRPRNVHRIIRATFGESSGQLPGNCRDVSGQLAGNFSQNADECPRQSLHQSWRDGSQMAWQLPPQSTPESAQYRVNHPGNCRATSEQCPRSSRETSHTTPVNVRTMVAATARRRLGNSR